jgi:hypothetical protein
MAVVSKRVAAHVIRKPVVEAIPEAVPEMQAAHETTRVDMRELQHILTSSVPVDLETDIEVCADSSEPTVVARSTRLAHTVRRAESQAEPAGATVEMQAIQIEAAHAAAEPDPVPVAQIEPPRRRARTTYYAAAAFVVAAISLVAVVASM